MPFALAGALPFADALTAARTMALGNAFGAAHFLQQDRWLDGDEVVSPAGARLSDVSFLRFVKEYSRLFPAESAFWGHFDRYLEEWFASLEWESRVLLSDGGAQAVLEGQLPDTLLSIGRKMSPLKATAAAVALLADRPDALARAERVVEQYHAGYQLADDLEDLEEDLAARRWSVVAWFMAARSDLATPADVSGARELLQLGAQSGALDELVELVCSCYRRAAGEAAVLGAVILESYLRRSLDRARRVLGRMSRRLTIAERADSGATVAPSEPRAAAAHGLHDFRVGSDAFVYDTGSGLFFEADRLAVDIVEWLRGGASGSGLDVLRMNHDPGEVSEALREVSVLAGVGSDATRGDTVRRDTARGPGARALFTMADGGLHRACGPSLSGIAAIALNVAGGCNLSCDYCYLGREPRSSLLMSDDTSHRAIDLLLAESFGERSVSVVFFGGEPLLNPGLIVRTAEYASLRAGEAGRDVSFHMTTNGTLLTRDVVEMLQAAGVHVLVSIDGAKATHDAHRSFPDGTGSYQRIIENITRLPEGMRPGARATVTEDSAPLVEIVAHLKRVGFGVIHLAPVSGVPMSGEFAERLVGEYEELARVELEAIKGGESPSAGCFIEPVLGLELGRQRLVPCGAGSRYVSVDHDGRLFLCHRFAGDSRHCVGDVVSGLDRFEVGRLLDGLAERSAGCSDCWALGLCGGACFHDVENDPEACSGPGSVRCRVTRRVLELSMWLYASLPAERRARLAEVARLAARPEIAAAREPGESHRGSLTGVNGDEGR
jgi:radical SAM protein with 4Fe4S-binding SPASM domain